MCQKAFNTFYKNEKSDQMNIYECLYILINMSAIYSNNENQKLIFYSYFFIEDNYCICTNKLECSDLIGNQRPSDKIQEGDEMLI